MNNKVDKYSRQKRIHSNAILEEIPTVRLRKININQYEEITSIAKLVTNNSNNNLKNNLNRNTIDNKNGERSDNKYLNFTNNSNKMSLQSISPALNRNLDLSNISNVAENNSINNSEDSTFCDLVENFSCLDLTNREQIVNNLLYGKNETPIIISSSGKKFKDGNRMQKQIEIGFGNKNLLNIEDNQIENVTKNLNPFINERYNKNLNRIEFKINKTMKFSNLNKIENNIPTSLKANSNINSNKVNPIKGNIFSPKNSSVYEKNKQASLTMKVNLSSNNIFKNRENQSIGSNKNDIFGREKFKFNANSSINLFNNKIHLNDKGEKKFSYLNLHTGSRPNFKDSFSDVLNKSNLINSNNQNLIFKNINKNNSINQSQENIFKKETFNEKGINLNPLNKLSNDSLQIPVGGKGISFSSNNNINNNGNNNVPIKIAFKNPNTLNRYETKIATYKINDRSFNHNKIPVNNVILSFLHIKFLLTSF